ncbi:hypothetical protein P5673_000144 [Acropora cervicornis]|uniref:G-protein coupled receptors family 1 profile domain-containing protein n=1 Tax=Acropora cervicornis TaxID=6130 RepID=A0AAD9R755_ACRCE|nr:hypothetical protein P5673_000144 [Acropora cervicornis]
MLTLLAVITERYIAVVHPLKYISFMTPRRIITMVLLSWGMPLILFVFRYIHELFYTKISYGEGRIIMIIYALLFEIVPPTLLVATTSHIIFTARKITLQMSALMVQVQLNQTSSSLTIKTGRTGSQFNYHLTLKMASAQVVESSVTNNSPCQDSNDSDDLSQSVYATLGFKPFT